MEDTPSTCYSDSSTGFGPFETIGASAVLTLETALFKECGASSACTASARVIRLVALAKAVKQ